MQGAAPETTQPQSPVQAQSCVAGKQEEGLGGVDGHQAGQDLAGHHCSKEGKADPGLPPQGLC